MQSMSRFLTLITFCSCHAFFFHRMQCSELLPSVQHHCLVILHSSKVDDEDKNCMILANQLRSQAEALRAEVQAMRISIDEKKENKMQKSKSDVDRWIEHLLVNQTIDENTQILNTVEHVMSLLRDGRYSQEQVDKMFDRICDTGPPQSRSNCSPILELLVDAAGKLDCMEREENPNKRWSGRVERKLRKRLFAMDFGFDIPNEEDTSI